MNKKLLYSIAITVSVLLVFVGIRVSSLTTSHSPKPRYPRAVIETTIKDSQEAGTKNSFSVAICQNALILGIPTQLSLPLQQQSQNCNFTPPELLNARAPPTFIA